MKSFTPTQSTVELHITYRCNLTCRNCSNLVPQAPAKMDMPVEMVREFLEDSEKHDHHWNLITVHGGEPCLHPKYVQIIQLLVDYRTKFPRTNLWWLSNDTRMVRDRIAEIEGLGISVGRAYKDGQPPYVPVTKSPLDLGLEHDDGCFQTVNCGCAFNLFGYWPCSPMASAARVFGYDSLGYSVADLKPEAMLSTMRKHCGHCGFSLGEAEPRTKDTVQTETWLTRLREYNQGVVQI